jgi:hypothetical protein
VGYLGLAHVSRPLIRQSVRPEVGIAFLQQGGYRAAVLAVWRPVLGDPAFDGLGIHAEPLRERCGCQASLVHGIAQPLIRHDHCLGRTNHLGRVGGQLGTT